MAQQIKRRRRVTKPPVAPPPDRLALSVEETAYVLGCSVPQVFKLLRFEALPRMRIGSHTRVSRLAVEEFIAAGGVDVVQRPVPDAAEARQ
jgi:excisionase family DNA binding protein